MLDFFAMGTHRLYYDDSYLQSFDARVLSCSPSEPFASPSGAIAAWEAILEQSAFYPASGGQPHDLGCIGDAKVLEVREDGDEIIHIVDRELQRGLVQASIQWPRRFDHMQQHTGQHLLSAMFHERFGLPTVSFHLGSEICTIDLRGPEPTEPILEGAQRAANACIFEDRPVTVRYGTAEQLQQIGVRKEVHRKGLLRAIEIASADLQPCGGTHVKSTGQIGMILLRRCTKIRQDWRVEFVCGGRAECFATEDYRCLLRVSDHLNCAPNDLLATVEKSAAERATHFKTLKGMVQELAEAQAALMVAAAPPGSEGLRLIVKRFTQIYPDLLVPLANEIAKHPKTVALLIAEEAGQIAFAQSADAGKNLQATFKLLHESFPLKGGGTRDFVRGKLVDPKHSASALILAEKLLRN